MVRIEIQIELNYAVGEQGADFIFNVEAARTACQTVSAENLTLSQNVETQHSIDAVTGNRALRQRALPGPLTLSYAATVDLRHHRTDPTLLAEVPVGQLPASALGYLYPSRYCQSDRLIKLAINQFGQMRQGHSRVLAIQQWVREQVAFTSNASNSNTSAVDTLIEQVGVCRDFAHLMIALCRAVNIPARFASGTDYGADPALGPPDFHAYVEVYLDGGWYIFDPSHTAIPMGLVRLGTGRDAADVAFATIFGAVASQAPLIRSTAVEDASCGFVLPQHGDEALSTDSGDGPQAMWSNAEVRVECRSARPGAR